MIHVFPNMNQLVVLHNEARSKASWAWNISELKINEALMVYAQQWALNMADQQKMKHSNIKNIMKLGFSKAGENIAYGQKTEESVMKTWLKSPGHRYNIMSTSYTDIGCGFAYSDKEIIYWCVCFGRPRDKKILVLT